MGPQTHLRASVALLAVFLAMGIGIEAALGARSEALVQDPLRREFLRLGHAHGGILSLLNLAAAYAMDRLGTPEAWARLLRVALFLGAGLVGIGFVGGGLWHAAQDPGPFVLLVPAGAMCLLAGLGALAIVRPRDLPPTLRPRRDQASTHRKPTSSQ